MDSLDSDETHASPAEEGASEIYTPLEVAHLCDLSRRRVYDWLTWGWLRGHHHGGRWQITAADWDYFQQTCRGARGRLMPSLYDWEPLWAAAPTEAVTPTAPGKPASENPQSRDVRRSA